MPKSKKRKSPSPTAKSRAKTASSKGKKKAKTKAVGGCPYKQAQLEALAVTYSALVNSSENWTWNDVQAGGVKRSDRKKIRQIARANNSIPVIPVDANKYPDFSGFVAEDNSNLPPNLYGSTDSVQFGWLNRDLAGRNSDYDPATQTFPPSKKKYTWHHHQDTGRMQLVEFGVHNSTNHKGGRTTWAQGKR